MYIIGSYNKINIAIIVDPRSLTYVLGGACFTGLSLGLGRHATCARMYSWRALMQKQPRTFRQLHFAFNDSCEEQVVLNLQCSWVEREHRVIKFCEGSNPFRGKLACTKFAWRCQATLAIEVLATVLGKSSVLSVVQGWQVSFLLLNLTPARATKLRSSQVFTQYHCALE